ncbi:ATP-binding protein, partial [Methylocucumis oryzae]|uniref:ATP-binding protein n=1 Tax=Methylocucumis oryzae TaxID=1632867 RepID=UPI001EF9F58D
IVQESLTNVLKHAYAQRVDVYLSLNNSTIVVSISDNGIGIKAEQLEKHNAFGILGMRERALLLHGILEIDCAPPGATIRLTLPHSDYEVNP